MQCKEIKMYSRAVINKLGLKTMPLCENQIANSHGIVTNSLLIHQMEWVLVQEAKCFDRPVMRLNLAEVLKHRVDHFKSLVDFLSDLGTSEDNLTADEDQQHDFRLNHAVDETREQLRFVRTEVMMARCQTLKTDGELDVARSDDVLDLEIRKLGIKAKLLNDTGILARGKLGVIFRLGTGDDHLAGSEDEGSRLGLTDTHDDGGETLGVVLCVSGMQSNRLEVQTAIKVDRGHDVLQSRSDATGALRSSRRRGRSCGSHPISVCRLLPVGTRSLRVVVAHRRRQLLGGTGERERARRGESLSLCGVGRMRLNAFHDWCRYRNAMY